MIKAYSPYLYKNEAEAVEELLEHFEWDRETASAVQSKAAALVEHTRKKKRALVN